MKAGKLILFILAGFALLFGFLYLLGSGGQGGGGGSWVIFGIIFILIGFVLIFLATRIKTKPDGKSTNNVTYNIDLPGNVNMDTIKCESCGGTLAPKDIQMVAGAPVVTCPWCNTTYQITEEPKW